MLQKDIVIIGGGITGLSTAYHLALYGCKKVTVLEKEAVGSGASGVAPGGVRLQWGTEVNCLMSQQSAEFYATINERLKPETDLEFRRCGYLFLAHSQPVFDGLAKQVKLQNEHGIPSVMLDRQGVADVVPSLNVEDVTGASYCAEDGYFDDPSGVVSAFARAARAAGVVVRYATATSIATEQGRVVGVMTTDGLVPADAVVLAAACDSVPLAATVGIDLPIKPEPRFLFFSPPVTERFLEPLVISAERAFAAKQMYDGCVLVSWLLAGRNGEEGQFEEMQWLAQIAELGPTLVPRLASLDIRRMVRGTYDMTPDQQAILGPVDGVDGFYLCAGFSGHGFMMAPAVGDNLARSILGMDLTLPLEVLGYSRFAKDALVPEPAII